jgi:hypothetical protein
LRTLCGKSKDPGRRDVSTVWTKTRVTDDGDKRIVACYRGREGRNAPPAPTRSAGPPNAPPTGRRPRSATARVPPTRPRANRTMRVAKSTVSTCHPASRHASACPWELFAHHWRRVRADGGNPSTSRSTCPKVIFSVLRRPGVRPDAPPTAGTSPSCAIPLIERNLLEKRIAHLLGHP